ncbi:hypothetical protein DFH09DRAFT_1108158 [Mycena vulgaris]|nr:hypothetical protein DFH09DRAFT_1108158 [Mycena vulgaris]
MRALRFKLEKLPINSSLNQETPMTILILESTMGSATLDQFSVGFGEGEIEPSAVRVRGERCGDVKDIIQARIGSRVFEAALIDKVDCDERMRCADKLDGDLSVREELPTPVMGWLATSSRIRTMASQMDQGRGVEESGCKRRITSKELSAAIAGRVFKVSRMLGSTGEELRRATHRVRNSMASQRREVKAPGHIVRGDNREYLEAPKNL